MYVRMLQGPCAAGFPLPGFLHSSYGGAARVRGYRAPQPASPLPAFFPEFWTGDCRHRDGMGAEQNAAPAEGEGSAREHWMPEGAVHGRREGRIDQCQAHTDTHTRAALHFTCSPAARIHLPRVYCSKEVAQRAKPCAQCDSESHPCIFGSLVHSAILQETRAFLQIRSLVHSAILQMTRAFLQFRSLVHNTMLHVSRAFLQIRSLVHSAILQVSRVVLHFYK
jgi:hypothetical protein